MLGSCKKQTKPKQGDIPFGSTRLKPIDLVLQSIK